MSVSDFYSINRSILLLHPTQALIDWVNQTFSSEGSPYELNEKHDNYDVFLLPELDTIEEALEWLQLNYLDFLEYELDTFCTDSSLWPQPLDWELFEKFFDYSIQLEAIDTVEDEEGDEEEDFVDFDDFDTEDD